VCWLELPSRLPDDGLAGVDDVASGTQSSARPLGGAFYDNPDVFDRYSTHRDDGVFSPNLVMEEPAVLDQLEDAAGLRVLDLGCGDAALGRRLLDKGCASYLGVDGSDRMIEAARRTLRGTSGQVVHQDIRHVEHPDRQADLITARLVLHYIPDVTPVLAACHRWLSPGGSLIVTVPHPVITSHDGGAGDGQPRTSWTVDDYFLTGPRTRQWMGSSVIWHHRTVQDYVEALLATGFTVTALSECPPRDDLFGENVQELRRRRRTPLFLLLAASP
jgi:SAM-dependent methyltransferase